MKNCGKGLCLVLIIFFFSCNSTKVCTDEKPNSILWFKVIPEERNLILDNYVPFTLEYGKNNLKKLTISGAKGNVFRLNKFIFSATNAKIERNKIIIDRDRISNFNNKVLVFVKNKENNRMSYDFEIEVPHLKKVKLFPNDLTPSKPLQKVSYFAELEYSNGYVHNSKTAKNKERTPDEDVIVYVQNEKSIILNNEFIVPKPFPLKDSFCVKVVAKHNSTVMDSLKMKYDFSGQYARVFFPERNLNSSFFLILFDIAESFIADGRDGNHGFHGENGRNVEVYLKKHILNQDSLLLVKTESNGESNFEAILMKNGNLKLLANGNKGQNGDVGNIGKDGARATITERAQTGQFGGTGGDGGDGGIGGSFTIYVDDQSEKYVYSNFSYENYGGKAGSGGSGGRNGENGDKLVYDKKTNKNKYVSDNRYNGSARDGRNGKDGLKGSPERIIKVPSQKLEYIFKSFLEH